MGKSIPVPVCHCTFKIQTCDCHIQDERWSRLVVSVQVGFLRSVQKGPVHAGRH